MPDQILTSLNVEKLKASLQQHEGLRLDLYYDTVGKATIGYGHNLSAKGITQEVADLLLADDLRDVLAEAQRQTWWPYVKDNEPWARAMCELLFNLGAGGVAGFRNMLDCLKAGNGAGAGCALLNSRYATQVGKRAKDIAALFEG